MQILFTTLFFIVILIPYIYCTDFYFSGSASANFNVILNWKIGSITGIAASVLPSASDKIFIQKSGTYDVTFGETTLLAYDTVTVGSASATGKQTLTLNSNFRPNTIEIYNSGIVKLTSNAKFSGTASIIVKTGGTLEIEGDCEQSGTITVEAGGTLKYKGGTIKSTVSNLVIKGSLMAEGATQKTIETTMELTAGAKAEIKGTGDFVINKAVTVKSQASLDFKATGYFKAGGMDGKLIIQGGGYAGFDANTAVLAEIKNEGECLFGASKVFLNATYTQTSSMATTTVKGGHLFVKNVSGLILAMGNLTAHGTVEAAGGVKIKSGFFVTGKVGAGASRETCQETETTNVLGDVELDSDSYLLMHMESRECHDKIKITGKLTIGTDTGLYLKAINNYVPGVGVEFDLLTHLGREGTFRHIFAFGVFGYEVTYSSTRTDVKVTHSFGAAGIMGVHPLAAAIVVATTLLMALFA